MEIAQRYFDAWNRRDAAGIMAVFAEGGTYTDPVSGALSGQAIGAYAEALWAAFPDLSFEVASAGLVVENLVAAEWIMRGTNLGSMNVLPPTGRAIVTRGADFVAVRDGKIASVQGYFDSRSVPEQLDLAIVVQPKQIGPFTFGISTHAGNGSAAKPGAFSITMLEVRSKAEEQQVADWGRAIATEMLGMPGFIGWMGATIGPRMVTITAWEDAEAPKHMLRAGAHANVMGKFLQPRRGARRIHQRLGASANQYDVESLLRMRADGGSRSLRRPMQLRRFAPGASAILVSRAAAP